MCAFQHISTPAWLSWSPPAKRLVELSFICDHKGEQHVPLHVFTLNYLWSLASFLRASIRSTAAWQRQQHRWCSYCRDGGEREGEACERVCGMSSQIVFTFHLVGSLSIQLFICISAGVCASSWRASPCVFVWSNCQSKEADSLLCRGLWGDCSNPSQRGIVCEIQMLGMARLFAYSYHCSLAKTRTVLGFDLTREKQNDKLSHQLSSNPPPPPFSMHLRPALL